MESNIRFEIQRAFPHDAVVSYFISVTVPSHLAQSIIEEKGEIRSKNVLMKCRKLVETKDHVVVLYFCDETKTCRTVDDAMLQNVNVLNVNKESSRDLLECRENKEILPRVHRPSLLKRSMKGKEITWERFQHVAKEAIERKARLGGFVIANTIRTKSTNIVEKDLWTHFCQVWSRSDCTYDCVRSAMCTS